MYYFDNKFLQQYLDTGAQLQIYYQSEWYNIADLSDLDDAKKAVGYDEYGESKYIPYVGIELIQVNGSIITIEQLQSMMTGKPKEDGDNSKSSQDAPEEEPDMEEPPEPEEEPKPKKKGPDLSWYSPHYNLGREILREAKKRKNER